MRYSKKSALLFLALPALFLSSCESFIPAGHRVSFNEAEFAKYGSSGSGTVEGQIVIRGGDDGEVHIGDQSHVTLLPVTSYTTEMVDREIRDGENLSASDHRLRIYVHAATADSEGRFVINNVSAGEYYLTGLVEWIAADDFDYQWACQKIQVGKGETVRVTLSRDIHNPGHPYLVIWRFD